MSFPGLLRFELRYQMRRVAFVAVAILSALLGLVLIATEYGPAGVDIGSPYLVTLSLGLLSLPAVFSLTIFCAEAALRDREHGMTELVFATPVGKMRWLGARFGGALLAGFAGLVLADLVLMLAPLLVAIEPARQGPLRPAAHLWALAVIALPNLLLVGALLFACATLTRSTIATYVAAVGIYALYWVAAFLVDSPLMASSAPPTRDALARAAVLDPFGLSAFFEQTRYWPVAERDVRPVTLTGRVLVNRLLWLGVSGAVLAFTYRRFAFRVTLPERGRSEALDDVMGPGAATALVPLLPVSGPRALQHAFGSALRLELRLLFRSWAFPALALLFAFVGGMEAMGQLDGEYGSRALATTSLMLHALLEPLLLLGTVALVYYTAECAWRERAVGIDAIVDATPAPAAVRLLAKVATLALLALALGVIAILVGVSVQLATGMRTFEPRLWLSLLWFGVVPLVLFAVGALAVHALSGNRWLGLLGGLLLALVVHRGPSLGLEHPLLRFGAAPSGRHSDLGGFGQLPVSFAAFVTCWAIAAALLLTLSAGVWPRGPIASLSRRVRSLPRTLGAGGRRLAAGAALAFLASAATLLYATTVAHPWESERAGGEWRANYERTFRRLHGIPQPVIVAVRSTVRLAPESGGAEIDGTYALENRTRTAVDTVWLAIPRSVSRAAVRGPSGSVVAEARLGMHAIALERPLAPGARIEVQFALGLDRGGVRASLPPRDVVANGTLLMSGMVYPAIGYQPGRELEEPALRREHGLAGEPTPRPGLAAADSLRAIAEATPWITLETTIATAPGQLALAPGVLSRQWDSAGRSWFRYAPERLVTPAFAIASARYEVARAQHEGVQVEVWHHPGHGTNAPRILAAVARTLDVLGARLGPYPHPVLRIAEVPAWWRFGAYAAPTLVLFPENRGFLSVARDGNVDLLMRRVAHEVAHQWWGHGLAPLGVGGATLLVETLAKDAEALVIADAHGAAAVLAMLAFDEDRYFAGRADEARDEPTLLEVQDEDHLYYGKGALMMHALRARLGDETVDGALRSLLVAHGGPGGMATSRDLRDALVARATRGPDSATVDEWLAGRTSWRLSLDSGSVARASDGWRVRAVVQASRTAPPGDVTAPLEHDSLELAVLDGPPGEGREIHTSRLPVRDGTIEFDVPHATRPEWLVLDPRRLRLEADRSDNERRLTVP